MASNPNPTRIPDALWRLWTEFDAVEPSVLLSGIYADKPGYHNYRDALPASDYSRRDLAADRRGLGGKAAALDLTLPDAAMKLYTGRLDFAARARDPRLYTARGPVLREFIGTKNGTTVYCYVLVGGIPLGVGADAGPDPGRDDSHLWHIHLSIIREFCGDWPALDGVLSVLKGESLPAYRERNNMALEGDQAKQLGYTSYRVEALATGTEVIRGDAEFGAGQPVWIVQALRTLAAEQKFFRVVVLEALGGLDTAAVLSRVEALAAAEMQRDAQLRALVEQHAAGQLDAEAVVTRMGLLLSAATPQG